MFHVELISACPRLYFNTGARQRIPYNLCPEQKCRSFYETNCGSLNVAYVYSNNTRLVKFSHFASLRLCHA